MLKRPLRMRHRSLLSGLLALCLAVGVLTICAIAVWPAGASEQYAPQTAPRAGDTASPSPRPSPTPKPTDIATAVESPSPGTSRNPAETPTSTGSSNGFLPDEIVGIPFAVIFLITLLIPLVLIIVWLFAYLRRRSARRLRAVQGPFSTRPLGHSQPLPAPKGYAKLPQEDASAKAPQQPPRVAKPQGEAAPPIRPKPVTPPPAAAPAKGSAAPAPSSTVGTVFCPECGLQQQVGSGSCPRCGFNLHQALTMVQGLKPQAPANPPVPAPSGRAPTPASADGPLPFTAAPDGGKKLPDEDEAAPQKGALSGQVLGGKYRLEDLLGRGGVGVVYKAHNQLLKRPQAVKVLLEHYVADAKFQERFLREAQTLAALDHANILPVHDFGLEEHRAYLVMPFISGGTLEQVLKRRGSPLDVEQVRRALQHIAAALDHAHAQGVVHLDLKPANMLLHPDGRLLLSDFGLAHLLEAGAVEGGTSLQFGTPSYMAPEHIDGQPEAASDIYALGIILYQLLTGQLPFQGSSPLAIIRKQATEPPPPLRRFRPELPAALEGVLGKALAKQPAARYQSAGTLLTAFQQVISAR